MKVGFVTGSNKGIGLALVEKLARFYGPTGEWVLYLTARNEDLGRKAQAQLASKGLTVQFHQLDITDPVSRKRFLDFMQVSYPDGINLAVNNAGIYIQDGTSMSIGEQARITLNTNFTCTVDFTMEFLPLLAKDARVVQVSSLASFMALKKLGASLYAKFTSPLTLDEVRGLMEDFIRHTKSGDHEKFGWPSWPYHVSKLGLTKASYAIGEMIKSDPRRIVLNSCCPGYVATDLNSHQGRKTVEEGADTPFYVATLPVGIAEPINQFVSEREVLLWSKDTEFTI